MSGFRILLSYRFLLIVFFIFNLDACKPRKSVSNIRAVTNFTEENGVDLTGFVNASEADYEKLRAELKKIKVDEFDDTQNSNTITSTSTTTTTTTSQAPVGNLSKNIHNLLPSDSPEDMAFSLNDYTDTETDSSSTNQKVNIDAYKRLEGDILNLSQYTDQNSKYHNIPLPEMVAIRAYTTSAYSDINSALRGSDVSRLPQFEGTIKAAAAGLNKMPNFKGTVVRGITLPPEVLTSVLSNYEPGKRIVEKAFVSTSWAHGFNGNVKFVVKSSFGKEVSWMSQYPKEREILFVPGSEFIVKNKHIETFVDENNVTQEMNVIEMEQVPSDPQKNLPSDGIPECQKGRSNVGLSVVNVNLGNPNTPCLVTVVINKITPDTFCPAILGEKIVAGKTQATFPYELECPKVGFTGEGLLFTDNGKNQSFFGDFWQ